MAVENSRTVTVYGLVASNEPENIRYIGQTTGALHIRIKNHLFDAKRGRISPVYQWVRLVLESGHEIQAVLIEEHAAPDISECAAIEKYRTSGLLLNERSGGLRGKHSEATKRRMACASKSKWKNEVFRKLVEEGIRKSREDPAVMSRIKEGILKSKACPDIAAKTSGEKNGSAKLTEESVREMRRQYALGISTSEIGRRFLVSQPAAWLVVNRKKWVHVT